MGKHEGLTMLVLTACAVTLLIMATMFWVVVQYGGEVRQSQVDLINTRNSDAALIETLVADHEALKAWAVDAVGTLAAIPTATPQPTATPAPVYGWPAP